MTQFLVAADPFVAAMYEVNEQVDAQAWCIENQLELVEICGTAEAGIRSADAWNARREYEEEHGCFFCDVIDGHDSDCRLAK